MYKEHLQHCVTILSARCLCLVQILIQMCTSVENERAELGRVADVSAAVHMSSKQIKRKLCNV